MHCFICRALPRPQAIFLAQLVRSRQIFPVDCIDLVSELGHGLGCMQGDTSSRSYEVVLHAALSRLAVIVWCKILQLLDYELCSALQVCVILRRPAGHGAFGAVFLARVNQMTYSASGSRGLGRYMEIAIKSLGADSVNQEDLRLEEVMTMSNIVSQSPTAACRQKAEGLACDGLVRVALPDEPSSS